MTFDEYKKIVDAPKVKKMGKDKIYHVERLISARISYFITSNLKWIKPNQLTLLSFAILLGVFIISLFKIGIEYFWTPILQLFALYLITIIDKVDGEVARVLNHHTQKGMYHDRMVHFLYPLVLYFVIAWYFFNYNDNLLAFGGTLILAVLTSRLETFSETKELIRKKIKEERPILKDLIIRSKSQYNLILPIRLFYYATFMVYAWTLLYYLIIFIVGFYSSDTATLLYYLHLIISLIVIGYRVLYYYPNKKISIY